ncbi:MAG: fumarylacetoacetate hydrolase family protein [Planctomycetota bacterium]|mgnify:CR=1 FL=1
MKWICYEDQTTPRLGRLEGEQVYPLLETERAVVSGLFEKSPSSREGAPLKLSTLKLYPPLLRPSKIICVGLNYRDHAEEQNKPIPQQPLLFFKASNCVIGHQGKVVHPGTPHLLDYEVELGVVIGKGGAKIPKEQAAQHIFGYTIFLDMTARDCQKSDGQWFRAKSFATFGPMGPFIREIEKGEETPSLELELWVNGELRQKSNTRHLIFDIPFLISYISHIIPLETGDLISTGTPAGVGVFRNPPVYLQPHDKITARIETLGTLEVEISS